MLAGRHHACGGAGLGGKDGGQCVVEIGDDACVVGNLVFEHTVVAEAETLGEEDPVDSAFAWEKVCVEIGVVGFIRFETHATDEVTQG